MEYEKVMFISAIENDEYATLEINEDFEVEQDTEFADEFDMSPQEAFNPVIVGDFEDYTEDEVDKLVWDTVKDIFEYEELWWDENNQCYYPEGIVLAYPRKAEI